MLKELIELWRSDNSLTRALNDSYGMLANTQQMFTESVKTLRRTDTAEMGINVYEMDQVVNKYQQEVRTKVLKHLALTGGANIIPGLILSSIVIDIERIGDYTKNIMDLAVSHPERLVCGSHEEDVAKIEEGVAEMFAGIVPALRNSDKGAARALSDQNWWMLKRCDEITTDLTHSDDSSLNSRDAVSTALYARYLKRIAAHLMNITSSILNPFERVGFREDEAT